ncbi:hypothetical protein CPLU01_01856 [Colletotrichum plurivorum]|uniref:AB hydrolase-1 domain-containing protein n=1 Tax=Colletotrichum plurivorum TaxID=2175906 RepID=A0A8H6KY81_9PEZI|nr:hypothetical protein CPLU01_01856 [Colletotrichum plurivorum]
MPEINPMQTAAAPPPAVSKTTILMSGLLCDVYGLAELSSAQQRPPSAVSCLWLYHGRLRAKEDMGDFAARAVSRWNSSEQRTKAGRGLIAVAFDQRNHGSRLLSATANESWKGGNRAHALDMYGMVAGMVSDTKGLMDAVEGYVKMEMEGDKHGWKIDQHLALGVSLGGHSVWQAMFGDARMEAGVVIIGCPDYMALMSDRAKRSKLSTYSAEDDGASFLGSRDFPQDLVAACLKGDPKGILFGTGAIPAAENNLPEAEIQCLRALLDARLGGKKILVCSGGDDRLVPYAKTQPFVELLQKAAGTWYADRGLEVENIVYDGVGHLFSDGMVEDACRFLVDVVARAGEVPERSKI